MSYLWRITPSAVRLDLIIWFAIQVVTYQNDNEDIQTLLYSIEWSWDMKCNFEDAPYLYLQVYEDLFITSYQKQKLSFIISGLL